MFIFKINDFDSFTKIINYVKNLMVPIPILISLSEITAYNIFGSDFLITTIFYRIALVLNFIFAIYMSSSSRPKMLLSLIFSFVFLWATVVIHIGNPQVYDIFFPLFSLLHIVLLKIIISHSGLHRYPKLLALLCFTSGFFLSMAELTRPFVFFLLPLLLFCSYQALKAFPTKYFIIFLMPIILFSGSWHFYIAMYHGQIIWTNHSGYNLIRAWPMVEMPKLISETNNQPLVEGSWNNLNTPEHYENSQKIQKAVLTYILKHPIDAFGNVVNLLSSLLEVQTRIHGHNPNHQIFIFYRFFVWAGCLWLFFNVLLHIINFYKNYRLQNFGIPENILLIATALYVCIIAIGESGEGARFLISILPFLAAFPSYYVLKENKEFLVQEN
jgi:hypothetical protein